MVSPIVRVDYADSSFTVNLNDIAFMQFQDGLLTIYLTFSSIPAIVVCEPDPEMVPELHEIYLDLYTKWKNKTDEDREIENSLLGFE